jgi:hypothetical protein
MSDTCDNLIPYNSPFYRGYCSPCEEKEKKLRLSPWVVQNICFELIANYMLANDPLEQGFIFSQRYARDPKASGIFLDLGLNYRDDIVQKRPAIFVSRGPVELLNPTMNQQIGGNARDSIKNKLTIARMSVVVTVIGTNIGFTEQLAEYSCNSFMYFAEQIRNDFFFRTFKLASVSAPSLYLESKDHIAISANVNTDFDIGFTITGDHLKLKTVSSAVFTDCVSKPLTLQ